MIVGDLSKLVWEVEHKNADPNFRSQLKNFHGWSCPTLFMVACMSGHVPLVRYLVTEAKCDTTATTSRVILQEQDAQTGWDIAIHFGRVEVHDLLVQLAPHHAALRNELGRCA